MTLELVIFDLDGSLVDSEPLQYRAYRDAFARQGVPLPFEDWPRWHEMGANAARWIHANGLDVDAVRVRDEKKEIYDALVAETLELKPGARALVEALSGSHRLCVASGSRIESIRGCLDKFTLTAHFERLFSATKVPRAKPHPDVFLWALAAMEVPAGRAVVIEDSVTGLRAATAAGIRCVVCPETYLGTPRAQFRDAAKIVESLEEVTPESLRRVASGPPPAAGE